jgi:hypothetical protein
MKKNPATTFIQLLRTKTIKNKIKNKYSEKNTKKEEFFFFTFVVTHFWVPTQKMKKIQKNTYKNNIWKESKKII